MNRITALYCRLSHEDSRDGESMSIENQRHILTRFAAERGFGNTKFFVDDGHTGTDFINRPGLNQLRAEIESGDVGIVIAKDQSRLGRHLFGVLGFKQMCEDYGVRYITVTDNYDTAVNGYDEMMSTVRDLMNDFYAADTSRKIRAVKRNNALQGKVVGKLPYGFRVENDKSLWLIDEPAAAIIVEIYDKFLSGMTMPSIARELSLRGVTTPEKHRSGGKRGSENWGISTVEQILIDNVYIGTYTSHRVTTVSHKNKKRVYHPEEDWIVIENHHAPIIDTAIFEAVQRMRGTRKRYTKCGKRSILSGLAYCKDCGDTLSYTLLGKNRDCPNFTCKTSGQTDCFRNRKCTRHSINATILEEYVFKHVKEYIALANTDRRELERRVLNSSTANATKQIKSKTAELKKSEREIEQIDIQIDTLFQDRADGKLSEERFYNMLPRFETKQAKLKSAVTTLRTEVDELSRKTANIEGFVEIAAEYSNIEFADFTEKVARLFLEKVIVHEPVYVSGTKRKKESQQIDVIFAFIGEM